jgi:hypothetical protein
MGKRHRLTRLAKKWADSRTAMDEEYNENGLSPEFYRLRDSHRDLDSKLYTESLNCPD